MDNNNKREDQQKKKKQRGENTEDLIYLIQEIEKVRAELNKRIEENEMEINSEEMMKLSEKLDDLITKYLKSI